MCLEPDTCHVSNKSIDFDFSKEKKEKFSNPFVPKIKVLLFVF